MRLTGPDREQCSSFEHELTRVMRCRETEEEPFVRIARQQQLKVITTLMRETQQAGSHRGADILVLHASASRYGFRTVWMRAALAAAIRSSMVPFRLRR
jgi:hypothetical protein